MARRLTSRTVANRDAQWAPMLLFVVLALLAGSCSSGDDPVAIVDGIQISAAEFEALRVDPDSRDADERVGDALVLILREAFLTRAASELDLLSSPAEIDTALASQRASSGETEARRQVTAELDAIRSLIETELVTTESDGFDLEAAQLSYLAANAEVCIRQMQFDSAEPVEGALQRLAEGEDFGDVARELSVDPFVAREDGVGAGGDLGCSAPSALPPGLIEASLDSPIDQPTGPVNSSVGTHVLEVYQRTTPDLDEHHDDVIALAVGTQGPELFRRWAVEVLQDIEVDVDGSVGRWGVLPETEPVPTVVPPYRFGDIVEAG